MKMAETNNGKPDSNSNLTLPLPINERLYRSKSTSSLASAKPSSHEPSRLIGKKDVCDLQVIEITKDLCYSSIFWRLLSI